MAIPVPRPNAPRRLVTLCLLLLVAAFVAAAPSAAEADTTRAVLTWDTDDTDVDLHVWDAYGNHAWFGEQDGIYGGNLSTDIIYGFGPEEYFAFDFEDETLTYGVCYFGSNREDEVVPETIATVVLSDPDGTTRTVRRRLRAEKEGFLLGSSPSNDPNAYIPDPGWCRGNPDVHDPSDDGGLGEADAGQPFEGCSRTRRRIGVVDVCADTVNGDGPRYTMTGNVRLNGSVAVGGPVLVNTDQNTISSVGDATIGIARGGSVMPVAAGGLTVNPEAVRDDVSKRGDLAAVELAAPKIEALTAAGLGVALSPASDGKLKLFLDRRDGGGLVLSSKIKLPLGGDFASVDNVTVGAHGGSRAPVRLLGGTVKFGEIPIGATGWRFSGLELSYDEAADKWAAKGGFATPALGLDVEGSLVGGQLNSLGLAIRKDVPLGQTGFILSSAGGYVDGLVQPPMKIGLTTSGRWGSLPGMPNVAIIHIKDVKLELDLSGRVSLAGRVEFLRPEGGIVSGQMRIGANIAPFSADGSLAAHANFGPVDIRANAEMKLDASHFTARGGAEGSLRGLKVAGARGVLSDKGIGVTGEICVGAFGVCARRVTLGGGMEWRKFPEVEWIGGDVNRYATISQNRKSYSVRVEQGRPLLFVDATGTTGTPDFELRSPSGRKYTTTKRRADSAIVKDEETKLTALTVMGPEKGRWVVRGIEGGGQTKVVTQAIRRIQRVRLRAPKPATTKRRRLSSKRRFVTVRWSSKGLPAGTRVTAHVAPDRDQLGTPVGRPRRARGSLRIPRTALRPGANYVRLVVSSGGVAVDEAVAPKPIWIK